jgi:GntR family transcriptional regulator
MQIPIDFRSSQPIYTQIVDQIRHRITTGALQPSEQLPTVRQLAADLHVNFNTVARAYRVLDKAGLISTQRGRGTYIWSQPPAEQAQMLRAQGIEDFVRRFLEQTRNLGFQVDEVEETLSKMLAVWRNEAQQE